MCGPSLGRGRVAFYQQPTLVPRHGDVFHAPTLSEVVFSPDFVLNRVAVCIQCYLSSKSFNRVLLNF